MGMSFIAPEHIFLALLVAGGEDSRQLYDRCAGSARGLGRSGGPGRAGRGGARLAQAGALGWICLAPGRGHSGV